ncbi:hypothetical protein GCM10023340_16260 [Nocardioides marinquilinus]|uniref:non-specific serine/threonine protein kinase n=1 Tax=Nocardioides marinquilinus TaxID=1210400 RepID=A0ABP9PKW3_9ACTN
MPGFRLLRPLAHGGRLDTWDALDEARGTRCVVKLVREDRRHEPHVVAALEREAAIVCGLAHPHLVRGYELVARDPDPPALVIETLRGATLGAVVEAGGRDEPLALPDVAELGGQLASVLAYLHRHDWLHLDVKPGNVVVDHGRAVLIDLGLAARRGPDGRAAVPPGLGTRGYLAPEQARGGPVSAAADVWGLAVTLVECLLGEAPHGEEATWDSRRRWPLLRGRLPAPPRLPADLPGEVAEVLLAALRHDPAARPRLDDVRDVLAGHREPGP